MKKEKYIRFSLITSAQVSPINALVVYDSSIVENENFWTTRI